MAEIEFVAPVDDVAVSAPGQLRQLGDNQVVTTYRNTGDRPVLDVRLGLDAYAVDDRAGHVVRPVSPARFPVVAPGKAVSTRWQVDVPLSATTGGYHLVGRATLVGRQGVQNAAGLGRTTLGQALDAVFDPGLVDLNAGESQTTALRVTNHAARSVTVGWSYNRPPAANPGFALSPSAGTLTIPAGGTADASVTASAAAGATGANPRSVRVDLTASAAGQPQSRAGSPEFQLLWYPGARTLASTFNNKGITDDANPTAGSFDGGEASFSAQGLAAAGLSRGATFVHDGLTFTWPDTAPGVPDNTATDSQVMTQSGTGTRLGIVGSACCSPTGGQTGTVFVTYDDGTVASAQLTFADWYFNNPAPGTDIVATVPWNVGPENPDQDHPVSVFYAGLPLDPAKSVRFVTLPSNPDLHIFAIAVGGS